MKTMLLSLSLSKTKKLYNNRILYGVKIQGPKDDWAWIKAHYNYVNMSLQANTWTPE